MKKTDDGREIVLLKKNQLVFVPVADIDELDGMKLVDLSQNFQNHPKASKLFFYMDAKTPLTLGYWLET